MTAFDYRDLLKRYIAHVGYKEGANFLDFTALAEYGGPFSPEELAELERIDDESVADHHARAQAASGEPK